MGTYQSKFTGAEIDSKLDQVGKIASAETLGGIKVGEGLEITEDGILSALGGASGRVGYTETVLFEGSLNAAGATADLSDSVLNYDAVIVIGSCDIKSISALDCCKGDRLHLVNTIMFMSDTGTESGTYNIYESNNSGNYHRECYGFQNATQVKAIAVASGGTWSNPKISKVIGIKLSGGSSSSGYSETVLWEGSVGSETTTNVKTSITLSDYISKFDKIGIYISYLYTGNYRYYYEELPVSGLLNYIYNKPATSDYIFYCFGYKDSGGFVEVRNECTETVLNIGATSALVTKVVGLKLGGGSSSSGDSTPVGNIISFMGTIAPDGYLTCDGTVLNITDYPKLASHFETQFGTKNHFGGDGTTTFAVPDLRDEFLRGYKGDNERQLSGEVGIHQDATSLPNMIMAGNGLYMYYGDYSGLTEEEQANNWVTIGDADEVVGGTNQTHQNQFTASSKSNPNGVAKFTTRPTNVAVLYCIKY